MQAKLWGTVFVDPDVMFTYERCGDADRAWRIDAGSVSLVLSEDQVLRLSQLLATAENEILDEPPVEVDAFINLRQRPARAIARGDWVDVGDHDFRQVTHKVHGHPVSVFTVEGPGPARASTHAWSNDSVRTIADRVTDCEGSTMPEPSDSWDVV